MLQMLRRNNKKILAVLGVFLMIAFIVPSSMKRGGAGQVLSPGKINGRAITPDDYIRAHNDFTVLTTLLAQPDPMDPRSSTNLLDMLVARRLAPAYERQAFQIAMNQGLDMDQVSGVALELARREARQMLHRLDAVDYLLLLKEAQAMGETADPQVVEDIVSKFPNAAKDEAAANIAASHLVTIFNAFERLTQSGRVSPAMATHDLSQSQQRAALDLVEFRATPLKASIPAPTAEQLQSFFEKYRDTNPDTTPIGFGYRFPNRVQIEFLKIPHDALAKAITEADLYTEFKQNPSAYERPPATTQPTTQASTLPATQGSATRPAMATDTTRPTTSPLAAATTRPTTQSTAERFHQLDSESLERIRSQIAEQRVTLMAKAIGRMLGTDWAVYRQAVRGQGSNLPADLPATSVGVPYTSPAYLTEVAKSIQLKNKEAWGVLASTVSVPQPLSAKQLALQPGIGTARIGGMEFAQYALQYAELLLSEADRKAAAENGSPTLALYQPSPLAPPLQDTEGNVYIFRLTQVEPANAPRNIEIVQDQVKDDYLTNEAYQKAKAEAGKFLATVKAQGLVAAANAQGLAAAAKAENRPVVSTGLFNDDPRQKLDKFQLQPDTAYPQLIEGAFDLVRQRLSAGDPYPLGVIEVPRAATVVVAQLTDAKPAIQHPYFDQSVAQYRAREEGERAAGMVRRWFDADAIQQRMNFVPAQPKDTKKTPEPLEEAPPNL